LISARALPQTPLGELTSLPKTPSWIWGYFAAGGGAGEDEGKGERKEREGEWRGGKGKAPKLLLNQGPSETCYATVYACSGVRLTAVNPWTRTTTVSLVQFTESYVLAA